MRRNFKRLEGRSVLALLRYRISEVRQSIVSARAQHTTIDHYAKSVYIVLKLGRQPRSRPGRKGSSGI